MRGLGVAWAAWLLVGCGQMHPPVEAEREAAAPPAVEITADMIEGGEQLVTPPAEASAGATAVTLSADLIEVAQATRSGIRLGLPVGIALPDEVKAELEAALAAALEQENFTIQILTQPADQETADWLSEASAEEGGRPDLLLVPHQEVADLSAAGLLRSFDLADVLYLSAPDARLGQGPAPTQVAAAEPVSRSLPANFYDPTRDPLAESGLGDPSRGEYVPFLYTALGLAAPAGGSQVGRLDTWATLFHRGTDGTTVRLVPEDLPPLFWTALIAQRKSPNSIRPTDYAEAAQLLTGPEAAILSPMPPGYPVSQVLAEGKAGLALVYGADLDAALLAEGRISFAIPAEGSVRRQYDFVVPSGEADVETARLLLAKLQQPELTAALARALNMTPALNPPALKLLEDAEAPATTHLPQARQYYEAIEGHEQLRARLDLDRQLPEILQRGADALPAWEPAAEEAAPSPPEPALEEPTPAIEPTATEPAPSESEPDSAAPAPAEMEPEPAPEPEASPAPEPEPESEPAAFTLPPPDQMPADAHVMAPEPEPVTGLSP